MIIKPGDFAKAFGAGADFIMSGGMFAGHDESGGELEREGGPDGHWVKSFYGMSSAVAMKKHSGGVANYRSSEGKAITVPCTFVLRLFVSSLPALLLHPTCISWSIHEPTDRPTQTTRPTMRWLC